MATERDSNRKLANPSLAAGALWSPVVAMGAGGPLPRRREQGRQPVGVGGVNDQRRRDGLPCLRRSVCGRVGRGTLSIRWTPSRWLDSAMRGTIQCRDDQSDKQADQEQGQPDGEDSSFCN